jgi:hypothetical protein
METEVHRIAALIAVVLTVMMMGGPTQADPVPDLVLTKITTSEATAAVGDRVVFRAFAKNLGPGTSHIYVTFSNPIHLAKPGGWFQFREVCVVPASESGDISEPSADTPSCEFYFVPGGDFVIVKIVAFVAGTTGERARLTFCTSNGQLDPDPDPANDCMTARIPITA